RSIVSPIASTSSPAMRHTSALTATPVVRYDPWAPAVLATRVSATSRSIATLTWHPSRASRSSRNLPISISRASEASAARAPCVATDQGFLDAHVRSPFGDGEGELPALPAAAAHLIPAKVAGDMVDAVERLEQVPRERDVLDELRHLAVADHVPVGRGEREILEHGLAAE